MALMCIPATWGGSSAVKARPSRSFAFSQINTKAPARAATRCSDSMRQAPTSFPIAVNIPRSLGSGNSLRRLLANRSFMSRICGLASKATKRLAVACSSCGNGLLRLGMTLNSHCSTCVAMRELAGAPVLARTTIPTPYCGNMRSVAAYCKVAPLWETRTAPALLVPIAQFAPKTSEGEPPPSARCDWRSV